MRRVWALFLILLISVPTPAVWATPTQYGDSGLISQPSADTHQSGSICVGLWSNYATLKQGSVEESTLLLPVSITLGLGSFIEAYGSYPNVTFNGDEGENITAYPVSGYSDRGFANIGLKARILGSRSGPFRFAVDGQLRRNVSDDPLVDGRTDYLTRGVLTLKYGKVGLHANGGYLATDKATNADHLVYGGGLEFLPTPRLRFTAEYETSEYDGVDPLLASLEAPAEATFGIQYHFSPHLAFSAAYSQGLSDFSPDWRTIVGFYTCQGTGTYIKPISPEPEVQDEDTSTPGAEPVKMLQLSTLSPLATLTLPGAAEVDPVSEFEVPVKAGEEEIVITPLSEYRIPEGDDLTRDKVTATPAEAPEDDEAIPFTTVMAAAVGAAMTQVAPLPVTPAALSAPDAADKRVSGGRSYAMREYVYDGEQIIGQKIDEEPDYKTYFLTLKPQGDYLIGEFYHDAAHALPVWVEGAVDYDLSFKELKPFTLTRLKVKLDGNKVPVFKLHIGEKSEVFQFGPPELWDEDTKEEGENLAVTIGKGVLLAPVAVVAAPFAGAAYLVQKATEPGDEIAAAAPAAEPEAADEGTVSITAGTQASETATPTTSANEAAALENVAATGAGTKAATAGDAATALPLAGASGAQSAPVSTVDASAATVAVSTQGESTAAVSTTGEGLSVQTAADAQSSETAMALTSASDAAPLAGAAASVAGTSAATTGEEAGELRDAELVVDSESTESVKADASEQPQLAVEAEEEGENLAVTIGKGILLAPVAVVAAPFAGAAYLVQKATESSAEVGAAATTTAEVAVEAPTASVASVSGATAALDTVSTSGTTAATTSAAAASSKASAAGSGESMASYASGDAAEPLTADAQVAGSETVTTSAGDASTLANVAASGAGTSAATAGDAATALPLAGASGAQSAPVSTVGASAATVATTTQGATTAASTATGESAESHTAEANAAGADIATTSAADASTLAGVSASSAGVSAAMAGDAASAQPLAEASAAQSLAAGTVGASASTTTSATQGAMTSAVAATGEGVAPITASGVQGAAKDSATTSAASVSAQTLVPTVEGASTTVPATGDDSSASLAAALAAIAQGAGPAAVATSTTTSSTTPAATTTVADSTSMPTGTAATALPSASATGATHAAPSATVSGSSHVATIEVGAADSDANVSDDSVAALAAALAAIAQGTGSTTVTTYASSTSTVPSTPAMAAGAGPAALTAGGAATALPTASVAAATSEAGSAAGEGAATATTIIQGAATSATPAGGDDAATLVASAQGSAAETATTSSAGASRLSSAAPAGAGPAALTAGGAATALPTASVAAATSEAGSAAGEGAAMVAMNALGATTSITAREVSVGSATIDLSTPLSAPGVTAQPARSMAANAQQIKTIGSSTAAGVTRTTGPVPTAGQTMKTTVYRKYRLPEFTFELGLSELSEEGRRALSMVMDRLRKLDKWFLVRIDGHTDSIGPADYNERLAMQRSISVANYLVRNEGLSPDVVFLKGFGERKPIDTNATDEGRQLNRRIELLVLVPKEN